MRPDRSLAASDLHLDRLVDADEVLDMGEEAGADKNLATTSLGLHAPRHIDDVGKCLS